MRVVRLHPYDLRRSFQDLLVKYGLKGNDRYYPSCLHMSEEDHAVLRRNNRALIREEVGRYISKTMVDQIIDAADLNYGPNTRYGKALKSGYILIDNDTFTDMLETEVARANALNADINKKTIFLRWLRNLLR